MQTSRTRTGLAAKGNTPMTVADQMLHHNPGGKPAKLKQYLTPEKRPYFSSRMPSTQATLPAV
jgi:hypothetical protein